MWQHTGVPPVGEYLDKLLIFIPFWLTSTVWLKKQPSKPKDCIQFPSPMKSTLHCLILKVVPKVVLHNPFAYSPFLSSQNWDLSHDHDVLPRYLHSSEYQWNHITWSLTLNMSILDIKDEGRQMYWKFGRCKGLRGGETQPGLPVFQKTGIYTYVQLLQGFSSYHAYSALKPLTCRILICFTMVLFPDSPAPVRHRDKGILGICWHVKQFHTHTQC